MKEMDKNNKNLAPLEEAIEKHKNIKTKEKEIRKETGEAEKNSSKAWNELRDANVELSKAEERLKDLPGETYPLEAVEDAKANVLKAKKELEEANKIKISLWRKWSDIRAEEVKALGTLQDLKEAHKKDMIDTRLGGIKL